MVNNEMLALVPILSDSYYNTMNITVILLVAKLLYHFRVRQVHASKDLHFQQAKYTSVII